MLAPLFYIYRHVRSDTNQVFYIGKGSYTKRHKFQRAAETAKRNILWNRVVAKCGTYDTEIIMTFDNEDDCFKKEREFIALYGRKNLGSGTLCNLTDGGEGHLGILISDERRKKMSEVMMGEKHPNWGKKLSAEVRKKKSLAVIGEKHHLFGKKLPDEWVASISAAKRGAKNPYFNKPTAVSKKVINTETGAIYDSIFRAAKAEGVNPKTLYQYLDGTRPNKTALRRHDVIPMP